MLGAAAASYHGEDRPSLYFDPKHGAHISSVGFFPFTIFGGLGMSPQLTLDQGECCDVLKLRVISLVIRS